MNAKLLSSFLVAAALLATAPASAEVPRAQWVAQCENDMSKDNSAKARRLYCTCMYEDVGDIRDKYEYALEREFPPVHLACYKKAGFKPPR